MKITIRLKINDICICYVSWGTGGKIRPVLIIRTSKQSYLVYKITSSKGKSKATQLHRYKIRQWQVAGLDKVSYVDFSQKIELSVMFLTFHKIGHLMTIDQEGLIKAINNYEPKKR